MQGNGVGNVSPRGMQQKAVNGVEVGKVVYKLKNISDSIVSIYNQESISTINLFTSNISCNFALIF